MKMYLTNPFNQSVLRIVLLQGALIGSLLILALFSLTWWGMSRRPTLAWQTLGLTLLCLNQTLTHSILKYFVDDYPFEVAFGAARVVGDLCLLVLMLYLRSLAHDHQRPIRGGPIVIALGAVQAALALAMLASDRYEFIQASQFNRLTILAALILVIYLVFEEWKLRYSRRVLFCFSALWCVNVWTTLHYAVWPSFTPSIASFDDGFSAAGAVLLCLAFAAHHQGAWRHRHQTQVEELLSQQPIQVNKAVQCRTRTLTATLEAAQHLNREKSRLMAYIGHDLRAPMATVVGYTRMLRDRHGSAHEKHIAAVERNAERQFALIDELLETARGELNLFGIKPVAMNLRQLLQDIQQHALTLAERQHNLFVSSFPEPFPHWVMLDGARLSQVLLNLLSNAAKFTHNGTLSLSIVASRQEAVWTTMFEITDTGAGIDPSDQERIFGHFEQANSLDGGLGLGLFIARSIVQNMGGRLTLSSKLGAGSTFRFGLAMPTAEPALPVQFAESTPDVERVPSGTKLRLTQVTMPSSASVVALSLLASNGEWTAINDWLATTLIEQPECGEFVASVQSLLEDLDFTSISQLARPDVNSTGS